MRQRAGRASHDHAMSLGRDGVWCPKMPLAHVILVEDDPRTRAHLAKAIEGDDKLHLAAACGDCASARAAFDVERPDVLLTDLGLPDGDGIELIEEVHTRYPETEIMVITISGDERTIVRAIEAGARTGIPRCIGPRKMDASRPPASCFVQASMSISGVGTRRRL